MELSGETSSNGRLLHDDNAVNRKPESKPWSLSKHEMMILASLGLNNLLLHICVSVMAPVFPIEIKKTHPHHSATSSFAIGMVFSVATMSDFISAPFLGREVGSTGPKLMVIMGTFLVGGVTVLFAFVPRIDDWTTFLALCYALRITKGFGAAMVFIASFSILATTFPDKIASVSGMLEVFSGLGFVIGPAVGGALYQKSGFAAPFLIFGCVLLAGMIAIIFLLPKQNHREEEKGSFSALRVLRQPRVLLMLAVSFWTSAAMGFFDPTLGPFLHDKLGISPSAVGASFLVGAGTYALIAPVVGYVADHHINWPIIPLGLLVTATGFFVMDLNGILDFSPHLWHVLLGFAVIGVGVGLASVPASADVIHTMENAGYPDSQALDSAIGGLLASATSLGSAVGPALGGVLTGSISFGDSGAVFGAVTFTLAVLVLSHTIFKCCLKGLQHVRGELQAVKGHLIPSGRTHFAVDFVRISGLFGSNVGQHTH